MLRRAVLCGQWLLALVFAVATVAGARAQEIEPREFLPLPAGTNLAIGYYIHGSDESYYTTGGNKVPHSNLEVNLGLARYVHYFNVGGMPAGVQAFQAFGSESGGQVGGQSLGSTFGAGNTALSAFIWPYANQAKSQYLIIVGFVYPPVGSYDKTQALNAAPAISGSFGWAGDLQIGWDNAIGSHFSYDIGVDTHFYGDTTGPLSAALPISIRTKHSNDFRTQVWLNWSWNPALTTSIGYEGIWGGNTYFDNPLLLGGVGHTNTGAAREQRLRAAVSMFLSPQFQLLLEGNHDVDRSGGFDQAWGLTLRGLYIF